MSDNKQLEAKQFEDEVRRIARALWPSAAYSGAAMHDDRERDGVFDTEDCRHIIEATTSKSKSKAQDDIGKLRRLIQKFRNRAGTKAVRGWFITQHEPTADQREVSNRHREFINTMSFAQFQGRLIDSRTYLQLRHQYAFGSIRDPLTGDRTTSVEYIPSDIIDTTSNKAVSREDLVDRLSQGGVVVLLGDYGSGKSMTLREIYNDLRTQHMKNQSSKFPVFLNLRDHFGQSNPAEILHRHGNSIGFSNPRTPCPRLARWLYSLATRWLR